MLPIEARNGPGELTQVGILVMDMDTALTQYRELLGATAADVVDFPSGVRVAHLFFPDIDAQIELLEPTADGTYWAEQLRIHGPGVHHLCFDVDCYDTACAEFAARGVACVKENRGGENGELRYATFDTSPLGFLTEIVNRAEVAREAAARNRENG